MKGDLKSKSLPPQQTSKAHSFSERLLLRLFSSGFRCALQDFFVSCQSCHIQNYISLSKKGYCNGLFWKLLFLKEAKEKTDFIHLKSSRIEIIFLTTFTAQSPISQILVSLLRFGLASNPTLLECCNIRKPPISLSPWNMHQMSLFIKYLLACWSIEFIICFKDSL